MGGVNSHYAMVVIKEFHSAIFKEVIEFNDFIDLSSITDVTLYKLKVRNTTAMGLYKYSAEFLTSIYQL